MDTLAIISRRPPYGFINAAEAVRHALGAYDEFNTVLLLIDNGVYLAKKGQDTLISGYTNLEETLSLAESLDICIDEESMISRGLKGEDLIDGVRVIGSEEIKNILDKAHSTMIF